MIKMITNDIYYGHCVCLQGLNLCSAYVKIYFRRTLSNDLVSTEKNTYVMVRNIGVTGQE